MSFQYGDVILVHGDNILSEMIQGLTDSFYSHAAMCVDPGKIVEMMKDGLHYTDNIYYNGSKAFIVLRHKYMYYSPPYTTKRIIAKMKAYITMLQHNPPKYDYFELIKQASKLIAAKGKDLFRENERYYSLNDLLDAGERLICSALIDLVYEHVGLDLFPGRPPFSTTPADLASLASGGNPAFIVVGRYLPKK